MKNFINKIIYFLKPYFLKLLYRIEFRGTDAFGKGERYVFIPKRIPILLFSIFVMIPFALVIGLYDVITTWLDLFRRRNNEESFSSFVKKEGETEIDLFRRF